MLPPLDLPEAILTAWGTNSRVTGYLIEHIPAVLWPAAAPGVPTARSERSPPTSIMPGAAGSRRWDGSTGSLPPHGWITGPSPAASSTRPSTGVVGASPPSCNVGHVLTYFVAHEAHHRGQIVMVARQLNCRLPSAVTAGLWGWRTRDREGRASRPADA